MFNKRTQGQIDSLPSKALASDATTITVRSRDWEERWNKTQIKMAQGRDVLLHILVPENTARINDPGWQGTNSGN